jgi:hypothetical protein
VAAPVCVWKDCDLKTYAELAAKLLRDAATFFRVVGEQNPMLEGQMQDNASVYEQVAELLAANPLGTLDVDGPDWPIHN